MSFSPIDSFIFLTNRVGRLLSNAVRHRCGDERLAQIFPHMGVLVDLWAKDGLRQQELAVSVIKDKGTITRSLDILERNGMVERRTDPSDRRKNRIYLTRAGKDLKAELTRAADDVIAESVEGIAPENLEVCLAALQRMYGNLNQKLIHPDGNAGSPSLAGGERQASS